MGLLREPDREGLGYCFFRVALSLSSLSPTAHSQLPYVSTL